MKKLSSTLLLLAIVFVANAGVLTVSNATINPGKYTSITAAIAAATAGDTILVQGSINNYGSFNVDKKVVIIGPGHNPVDKQYQLPVTVDDINFTNANGSDSKIYGLNVSGINTSATSGTIFFIRALT